MLLISLPKCSSFAIIMFKFGTSTLSNKDRSGEKYRRVGPFDHIAISSPSLV